MRSTRTTLLGFSLCRIAANESGIWPPLIGMMRWIPNCMQSFTSLFVSFYRYVRWATFSVASYTLLSAPCSVIEKQYASSGRWLYLVYRTGDQGYISNLFSPWISFYGVAKLGATSLCMMTIWAIFSIIGVMSLKTPATVIGLAEHGRYFLEHLLSMTAKMFIDLSMWFVKRLKQNSVLPFYVFWVASVLASWAWMQGKQKYSTVFYVR